MYYLSIFNEGARGLQRPELRRPARPGASDYVYVE